MNKYQGDVIRICKLDPGRAWTVLYWDNAAKAYYIKRFSFVESNNTPVSFISEAKGSKLVDLSDDLHPQVKLTFGGRQEGRGPEVLDAEEFIAKKGLAAKGKKCSSLDLRQVEFIEPLHKPEDDINPEDEEPIEIAPEDEEVIVDEPAVPEDEPIEIELDIEVPEIPVAPAEPKPAKASKPRKKKQEEKKDEPDEPASDFTDWTLF